MKFYNPNNDLIIDIAVEDSSSCTRAVMQAHYLDIELKSADAIDFLQGTWAEFEGVRYTLYYPAKVTKIARGQFLYNLTMHTAIEETKNVLIKDPSNPPRTAFTFTGTPREHLELVRRSMGDRWVIDSTIEAAPQMIAYSNESCWSALGKMAQTFSTEWVAEGTRIGLRKDERFKNSPVPLSYGKGNGILSGVARMGNADKIAVGKLYVIGGTRNIDPSAYGSTRLHLPKGETSGEYKVDKDGLYLYKGDGHGRESVLQLDDIYPHRQGTVSDVVVVDADKHFYDIKDSTIPADLNFNDYRIPSQKAVLKFETGMLAGREFDLEQDEKSLKGYIHEERRFRIVPREIDGVIMPGGVFLPAVGDKYAIFNISLPPSYIKAAEQEIMKEAVRTLTEQSADIFTFQGELSPIYAKEHWLEIGGKLVPGGHIKYTDDDYYPDGEVIRITSIKQSINNPHSPSMTLSTATVSGTFSTVISKVEAQEVVNKERHVSTLRQLERSWQQVDETRSMIERAYSDLGKSISAPTVTALQIIAGDQYGQFRFYEKGTNTIASPYPLDFDKETAQLKVRSCDLQHSLFGSKGERPSTEIKGGRKAPARWRVNEWASPALPSEKSYYVYAVTKGAVCSIEIDESPRKTGDTKNAGNSYNYTLPVGILTAVDRSTGTRSFAPLHGFTEITPGQIATDRIRSTNDKVDINLLDGEFIIGDPSGKTCLAYIGGVLYQKGLMIGVGQDATTIEDAIKESSGNRTYYSKPTKYKKGDRWVILEDTILNGTLYKKGQTLEAVYTEGKDADWRLVEREGTDETEGVNLIRNYDLRFGGKFWGEHDEGNLTAYTDEVNELPTDFYKREIKVVGDEYGYEYAITTEKDELIIWDE